LPPAGGILPNWRANSPLRPLPNAHSGLISVLLPLAFTLAPHLQLINYHGCFSPFAGI
jgi:hypothetical protein